MRTNPVLTPSKVRYISHLGLSLSKRSVFYWVSPLPVFIPSKNDLVPTAASPRIESEAKVETKSYYK